MAARIDPGTGKNGSPASGLWIAVSTVGAGFQHTVAMFINLAVGLSIAYLALLDLWLTHYGQSTEKA